MIHSLNFPFKMSNKTNDSVLQEENKNYDSPFTEPNLENSTTTLTQMIIDTNQPVSQKSQSENHSTKITFEKGSKLKKSRENQISSEKNMATVRALMLKSMTI